MVSPYEGYPESQWTEITRELVEDYPLDVNDIVDAVLAALEIKLQDDIELLERDDEDSYSKIEDAKFYTEKLDKMVIKIQ